MQLSQLLSLTKRAALAKNGIVGAVLLAPAYVYAQSTSDGSDIGLGGVSGYVTSFVSFIIYTLGYPVGAGLLAVEFWRWKSGRASLQQFLIFIVAVVGFFFAPNIVRSVMQASGGSL